MSPPLSKFRDAKKFAAAAQPFTGH